jgi:tRNA-dihydrouridine synthase B
MSKGFWNRLPKRFCGLAPMDGVTDYLYRHIQEKYSKPDLMITEFTAVEGIAHNALKLLKAFEYDESQRPMVAQVFGIDPESFYITAIILCELGFDGIDINMGCPAKNVRNRGAGAALIINPSLATEIIEATLKGVTDFSEGKRLNDLPLKTKMKTALSEINPEVESCKVSKRKKDKLPVSVKTRIGYSDVVIDEWAEHLTNHNIAALTIHGRTLNQMYSGEACWESIAIAANIAKSKGILAVGNGDIKNRKDGEDKCQKYGLDGVLIGRATFGNPWVFDNHEPSIEERVNLALYHSKKFEEFYGANHFYVMRKFLAWYIKGIEGAKKFRKELMLVESFKDVEKILKNCSLNIN